MSVEGTTDPRDPYASVDTPPAAVGCQSFVKVLESETSDDFMELPVEEDGTLLLSTLNAQFPSAVGLKYKSASGNWGGIRSEKNVMYPPNGGWGEGVYYISGTPKRKTVESNGSVAKVKKRDPEQELLQDLIVKNLSVVATEEDLTDYFVEKCGELAFNEVKLDAITKKSRGFAFIRFKTIEAAKLALSGTHIILGQLVEVQKSIKRDLTLKLFVGRLPVGTTQDELRGYFAEFGELIDAFVPNNFRGFGFVTYADGEIGRSVLRKSHEIKGSRLNVTTAAPKDTRSNRNPTNERPEFRQKPFDKPPLASSSSAAAATDVSSQLINYLATSLGKSIERSPNNPAYSTDRPMERSRPPQTETSPKNVNNEIISLLSTLIGGK